MASTKMSKILENVREILLHNVQVHVYSSPNFAVETFITLLMCFIHCILILEINEVIKSLKIPVFKVRPTRLHAVVASNSEACKGVVRNHPDLGVDVVFKKSSLISSQWDTMTKINKILSTSLSEYIKRDLKKIKPQDGDGDDKHSNTSIPQSIDKMYENHRKDRMRFGIDGGHDRTEIVRLM